MTRYWDGFLSYYITLYMAEPVYTNYSVRFGRFFMRFKWLRLDRKLVSPSSMCILVCVRYCLTQELTSKNH